MNKFNPGDKVLLNKLDTGYSRPQMEKYIGNVLTITEQASWSPFFFHVQENQFAFFAKDMELICTAEDKETVAILNAVRKLKLIIIREIKSIKQESQ